MGRNTVKPWLSSDPAIMGGAVCFAGTRIPLKAIVVYIRGGMSDEEILEDYPSLSRVILARVRRTVKVL